MVSNLSIEGVGREGEGIDPLTFFHPPTKRKFDQGVKKRELIP